MSDIINSVCSDNSSVLPKSDEKNVSNKYFNTLKAVAETNFGCIYIADLKTGKMELISENRFLFSGLGSVEVEKMGFNFFRKYTRSEDLDILKKVKIYGFKFFECLSPEEKKRHTITYDFHVKYANSVDVLINHKITPIELCEKGDISKIVCVVSYSLNRAAGNIRVLSNTSDTYWKYNLSTGKWSEEAKITLKIREIEIIRLYLQGMKIEEIAEQLFVAPSTIKFHRSKLFERIGVKNIIEAISYVITNNLI
ncbi:LuxR C-terminal-related transcriptional regulator [Chryseobacterium sp.]|uniref:response regulator transcription factor n=1 Tax=Chryseobacterium sp. TaxID=1871047 RepID=UPI00260CD7AE|nr:LuxR C-terminal-related transcriptional regulator [Chryseobacterium sp.]